MEKLNMNTQKYPAYKDSGVEWLGEIPKHWEVNRIKFLFKIGRGRVISQQELIENGKYPVYSSQTLDNGVLGYINTYDFDCTQITWTTDGANAGTVFLREGKHNCTNVCGTLQPQNNEQIIEFVKFALQVAAQFYKRPDTNGAKIMNGEMGEIFITVPSKEEQTTIANFLDRKTAQIESAIAIKQKQIELLKERRQILIHRAVTRGLNPNVTLKDSGVDWIGEIPEGWEVKPLRYIGKSQNGISKGAEYFGKGFPFVNYGDVYKDITLPLNVVGLAKSSIEDRKQYSVIEGDIFFTRTSETVEEIGYASICMQTIENATFSGFIIRVRPTIGILHKGFSKYYFRSQTHRAFFVKEMNLVIRASLSQELLKKMPVLLPPINEQIAIAKSLDNSTSKISTAISLKEKEIEKLKEYKSVLINAAVSGKIKIK